MKVQNVHISIPTFDMNGLIEVTITADVIDAAGKTEPVSLNLKAPFAIIGSLIGLIKL